MTESLSEQKKLLRKELIAKRDELSAANRIKQSQKISGKLIKFIEGRKPKGVHTFLPMGAEVNIYPFIEFLLSQRIPVYAPESKPRGVMIHRKLHSLKEVESGIFGTTHPTGEIVIQPEVDLCIVPGLGFSTDGLRLGYGGGYYDRYLSSLKGVHTIGVCYDNQIVHTIPSETHDFQVDHVFSYL